MDGRGKQSFLHIFSEYSSENLFNVYLYFSKGFCWEDFFPAFIFTVNNEIFQTDKNLQTMTSVFN